MPPVNSASEVQFLNAMAYNKGRCGRHLVQAVASLLRDKGGETDFPTPRVVTQSLVAASVVLLSGAGRIYHVRVESGTAVEGGAAATADVIVRFTNGATIVTLSGTVTLNQAAEFAIAAGADGAGQPFATDIRVAAFLASDGTTPAATVNRPTVKVLLGG